MKSRRISIYIIVMVMTASLSMPSMLGRSGVESKNVEIIEQLPMTYAYTNKACIDNGLGYVLSKQENPNEGSLDIIDLTMNPPALIGSYPEFISPVNLFVHGGYAYVVDHASSTRYYIYQIDVTDPANPEETEYLSFSNVPTQTPLLVAFNETQMYVAYCRTLSEFRLNTYALPGLSLEASKQPTTFFGQMTAQNSLIYVAGYSYEVMDYVFEIYDMETSEKLSYVSCMDNPTDVEVVTIPDVGTYCYLPVDDCIEIIEVTDPATLSEGTVYPVGYTPVDCAIDGMFLYLNFGPEGFTILNIGEPGRGSAAFPSCSGSFDTVGSAASLDAQENRICIADGESGLCIAQFLYLETPQPPTGDTEGAVGTSYEFHMTVPESLIDDAFVLWRWGDGTITEEGPFSPGDLVTSSHTWSFEDDYLVEVKVRNQGESLWSNPLIFIADDPSCWARRAHNLQNTGETSGEAPDNLALHWSILIGDHWSVSSPLVYNNNAFLSTVYEYWYAPWETTLMGTYIECVDAETGAYKWSFTSEDKLDTDIVVHNGNLYFILSRIYRSNVYTYWFDSILYCMDAETGDPVWSRLYSMGEEHTFRPILQINLMTAPLVYDGHLYTFMGEKYIDNETHQQRSPIYVCCFNISNGDIVWTMSTRGSVTGRSPAIYNDRLYFGSSVDNVDAGRIFCVDPHGDGQGGTYTYWSYYTTGFDEKIASDIVLSNGCIFFTTIHDRIQCLNADNGELLWDIPISENVWPIAAGYGKIYAGASDYVVCIDAVSSEQHWQFPLQEGERTGAISLADGKVYVGTYANNPNCYFYCLDAESGEELWRFWQGGEIKHSTAIANGYVYTSIYRSANSAPLHCFGGPTHPPEQPPRPIGMQEVERGRSYVFSTKTTDPDGAPVQYGWDWDGDLQVDEWTDFYPTRPTSDYVEVTHSWPSVGTYQVRVKARDAYDESEWSEPLEVRVMETDLAIANVVGGIRLHVTVSNDGENNANDIPLHVTCDGGLVLWPRGTLDKTVNIPAGNEARVNVFVLGFGKTTITVTLGEMEYPLDEQSVHAFLFGCLILLNE